MNQELKQVRGLVTGVPYFVFNKGQGDQEVHISGAQVGLLARSVVGCPFLIGYRSYRASDV